MSSRIAIIDKDKCKPKKCKKECMKACPVNSTGKMCVEIEDIAKINESLCIGCNACVSKCPFNAIKIIKLPGKIENDIVHSYGENLFKLYKLPMPKPGKVIGIIGQNGCGKSTTLDILSGKIIPNFDKINTTTEVLKQVRGTELQKYLKMLYDKKLTISYKPQNILKILKQQKNKEILVKDILDKFSNAKNYKHIVDYLNLYELFDNKADVLSGGELQRVICAITLMKEANVYVFDEPSNYLDIEYRIKIANLIKELSSTDNYIFVVDHDLSILDFVTDYVHIMYGEPGCYGVISTLASTLDGINMYFDGYIPADNIRFRTEPYKLTEVKNNNDDNQLSNNIGYVSYEDNTIEFDNFKLFVKGNTFNYETNMIIILGRNGTGKSTYLNYLKDTLGFNISFKPQMNNLLLKYDNIEELLYNEIKDSMLSPMFVSDVINMLGINKIMNKKVTKLSGGELQRLSLTLCLGKNADIYLLDEPSASLDVEYRFNTTKVIKRFMLHNKKIGFIVEHDILMAITLAKEQSSRVLVFEEVKKENGIRYCQTSELMDFENGINKFLGNIDTTFRTDKVNHRPKINKLNSVMDNEQKASNKYFI